MVLRCSVLLDLPPATWHVLLVCTQKRPRIWASAGRRFPPLSPCSRISMVPLPAGQIMFLFYMEVKYYVLVRYDLNLDDLHSG